MVFKKFVEIGRVAFIAAGPDEGKICAIVDVIDQNRALVDGPCTDVKRQEMRFKDLHLTNFKIKIGHSCHSRYVKSAWVKDDITNKWLATSWAKKLEDHKKRFKISKAKQRCNKLVRSTFVKLRRAKRQLELQEKSEAKKLRKTAAAEKTS